MVNSQEHPFQELLNKENLTSEKWKPVNDKIYKITASNEMETLPFMQITVRLMKMLNENFSVIQKWVEEGN